MDIIIINKDIKIAINSNSYIFSSLTFAISLKYFWRHSKYIYGLFIEIHEWFQCLLYYPYKSFEIVSIDDRSLVVKVSVIFKISPSSCFSVTFHPGKLATFHWNKNQNGVANYRYCFKLALFFLGFESWNLTFLSLKAS